MKQKKIALIVGARPNFVKIAPLIEALNKARGFFKYTLIHTNQHYDYQMSQIFFKELDIPKPDVNLDIQSNKYPFTTQIALIKKELEKTFKKEKPDLCLVVGDCNSAIGGALAAKSLGVPLAHLEAGLRSFDRTMTEESNRLVVDILADFLFTSSEDANQNLINEGCDPKKIYFVGNIMIDTLLKNKRKISDNKILENFKIKKGNYGVLTLHRYNNIDIRPILKQILKAVFSIQKQIPIVFIIHPSTKNKIRQHLPQFYERLNKERNLTCTEPLGYLEMLALLKNSALVLTDSGGIQEEATYLKVPCLTLRQNTERPVTAKIGTNIVAGIETDSILRCFLNLKKKRFKISSKIPSKWDGKTAKRVVEVLIKKLK
jgi:UDP-N-acetylglucosamine 2-epimerase (non-hydrolysing)